MSQRTSTGPTVLQALMAGAMFAAFGSLCVWLGKILSQDPAPPPALDSLAGASNPAELNRNIDELLIAGEGLLDHDRGVATAVVIIVSAACVLALGGAIGYVVRLRRHRRVPSSSSKALAIGFLATAPAVLGVGLVIKRDAVLHALPVQELMTNSNTRPEAVSPGDRIVVELSVPRQSFFGYHTVASYAIDAADAHRPDGTRDPVVLADPEMSEGGREPGRTDVIPVMENVVPRITVTLPDDSRLQGSIISLSVSGAIRLMPDRQKKLSAPQDFRSSTTFRVIRAEEAVFASRVEGIKDRMRAAMLGAFATVVVLLLIVTLGAPDESTWPAQEAAKGT